MKEMNDDLPTLCTAVVASYSNKMLVQTGDNLIVSQPSVVYIKYI